MKIDTQELVEALEPLPVELAVLFGSAARGDERDDSDVDVGLRFGEDAPDARRRAQAALSRAAGRAVDVVDLDGSPPLLRFEIARDGVVLLERRTHAWSDFKARAMIDWWDWAPTARWLHRRAIDRLKEKAARGPA